MPNFASSKLYKQNKYRLLGDDKTSFSGNRLVISHTVEVSTLGLASDTKDFTSATKLPDIPNSLWHSVACQALSSSLASIVRETLVTILTNPRIYNMSSVKLCSLPDNSPRIAEHCNSVPSLHFSKGMRRYCIFSHVRPKLYCLLCVVMCGIIIKFCF